MRTGSKIEVKEEKKEPPEQSPMEVLEDNKKNNIKAQREIVDRPVKEEKMENYFDSKNLLTLLKKWRVHLTVIVIIAIILGAIFSGPTFITPLYKSYGVVYPANIDSYSEESNTEQMLQIINSQEIVDSMIVIFNLGKHYNIDPQYKYYQTALLNEYHDRVRISKTPYESVMIEVYDQDPVTAKKMVDRIIKLYDWKVGSLHKQKYREVVDMYQTQLRKKRDLMDSLAKEMKRLGTEEGVFNYDYQSQQIMSGYLGTVTGNGKVNKKEAKRLFKNMGKYSGKLITLSNMLEEEAIDYVEVKHDLELAQRFVDSHLTYSNIVTHPFVADKKSYPIRWLVVAIVAIAAFVFTLLVIFAIENKNRTKA